MAKAMNTAGKPRATKLVAHSGTPGQKVASKKNVLVHGKTARTGC